MTTFEQITTGVQCRIAGALLTAVKLTRETTKAGPDSPFQHTVEKAWRFWIDGTTDEYVTFTESDLNEHGTITQLANQPHKLL